jgi:hypothetical protein
MARVVNIEQRFARFTDTFPPKIVGELNGQHVKLILFEPDGIAHTGNVRADITRDRYDRLA